MSLSDQDRVRGGKGKPDTVTVALVGDHLNEESTYERLPSAL